LIVVQAAPGVGKSFFGLAWAHRLGGPALVVSLDTDLRDQALRLVSMETGEKTIDVENASDSWVEWLAWQSFQARFCDFASTVRDVDDLVAAETSYWGQPPGLVVVDNAGNLLEGEESAAEYRRVFGALHRTAKRYGVCVLALHHIRRRKTGNEEAVGTTPTFLGQSLYSGEQDAPIVLGLWRPQDDLLAVAVLKNRMGPANPGATLRATLRLDLQTASLEELSSVELYKEATGL